MLKRNVPVVLLRFAHAGIVRRILLILLAFGVFLPAGTVFGIALTQVEESDSHGISLGQASRADRQVSRIISTLLQRDHLSSKPLDDAISERAFKIYIQTLDPMKVYFTKSDVDSFSKWRTAVDDRMKQGDYEIAFAVFKRFLERVDERVELINKLLDQEFDFTTDEEMPTDSDLIEFATTDKEIEKRWLQRLKYNLLVLSSDKESKTDPRQQLKNRYTTFARRMHQTDSEDVVEMYISAVTTSFDPHTTYMSKETFENFMIAMRLELEGIGATLQASEDDGYTVIKKIVPGGAADKHGELKVEDKIVAVGQGKDEEMVDVTGMKLDDVVKLIRGKAGTMVRLAVLSESNGEIRTINIVREQIKLEDSAARGVIWEEGKKPDGSPFKIGFIDLPSFYSDMESANRPTSDYKSTTRDMDRILRDFKAQNVDAVVVDLSRNGGGSLREAIDCTGLFINEGPIVQVKDAYGQIQQHDDVNPGMSWDGPVVVMTSKFSASASEILAAAIQDYGRGIVVGDTTTHGKGTVQSLVNINQLVFGTENPPTIFGALKITMQQFYRPNGDSTQKRGVLADVVLPSITDKMDISESDLDYAVEFDKIPSAKFPRHPLAQSEIVNSLRKSSAELIKSSEHFRKVEEAIAAYVEQKNHKTVPLNQEKFLARREKLNAEEEDEQAIEDQINHSNTEIKRTAYIDEVLRIAIDYTTELATRKKIADNAGSENSGS
jgi:carboxyl-terminal processing protease